MFLVLTLTLTLALTLILALALIWYRTLRLSLRLSGLHQRLLAGVAHGVLVLRQTIDNSTATSLHAGTQVLCVGLARGAHLVQEC